MTPAVVTALGAEPGYCAQGKNLLAVFDHEAAVAALKPDFRLVAALAPHGLVVTAPADDPEVDFVSRFFAPGIGVDEDPTTGSAHCTLTPYWAGRLGKNQLHAIQISQRRGELWVTYQPENGRVLLEGHAVTYLRGTIFL